VNPRFTPTTLGGAARNSRPQNTQAPSGAEIRLTSEHSVLTRQLERQPMHIDKQHLLLAKSKIIDQGISEANAQSCIDSVQTHFKKMHEDVLDMQQQLSAAALSTALTNRMTWAFGSSSAATIAKVKRHVTKMHNVISRPTNLTATYSEKLGSAEQNIYAHVYPHDIDPLVAGSLFIYMDYRFTIDQEDGLDNRYLTLVHEFSHLACKTKDYQYESKWDAQQCADGNRGKCIKPFADEDFDTDKAVDNADSYGYFFAATYARARNCAHP
jgi:hypothetical protein